MKKRVALFICFVLILSLAACGNRAASSSSPASVPQSSSTPSSSEVSGSTSPSSEQPLTEEEQERSETPQEPSGSQAAPEGSRVLVAYFAYAENIGDTSDMDVDAIASASIGRTGNRSGNLQLMAQIIRETQGADVFHIVIENPYDPEYNVMHDRAVEEINSDAQLTLTGKVENLDRYDTVYLGTPVWSGAMPQPVVTFLRENDLSGKTIIPFGIHLGSRFGRILNQIGELAPGATLAEGFTVEAGTANRDVQEQFSQWLSTNQ